MTKMIFLCLGLIWFSSSWGCTAFSQSSNKSAPPQSDEPVASEDVPPAVAERARRLAEDKPALKEAFDQSRVVYIGTEIIRWKTEDGDEDPRKIYRVIHYRYDNDAAVHSIVNVRDEAVLQSREYPHLPTAFSAQELKEASELALKDERVREGLGDALNRAEIEGLVIRASSKDDPWFGRRVVRLLFRVGQYYRRRPIVIVDLTERRVVVEKKEDNK
ncbi:MAG: hypothetical protein HKN25_05515 [Pyrinomonadaceae bacterium]|nr:hypothetical protein [Pyrinomonadaceae bacterium]